MRRITPERSAKLHRVRHEAYEATEKRREEVELLLDNEVLAALRSFQEMHPVELDRSTPARIMKRMLAREAHRRGLIGGET